MTDAPPRTVVETACENQPRLDDTFVDDTCAVGAASGRVGASEEPALNPRSGSLGDAGDRGAC